MTGESEMHITDPAQSRRSGERRRRGAGVRHDRTGIQAERSRSRSGRGRAAGDQGQGGWRGAARRGQLLAAKGAGGRPAGGAGLPQKPDAVGHRRQAKRSGAANRRKTSWRNSNRIWRITRRRDRPGIAIQEAARKKAEVQAATARKNIEAMTMKAHRAGYVAIRQNPNINCGYRGMTLPPYPRGRPGASGDGGGGDSGS